MLTSFAGGTVFGRRTSDAPTVLALHGWGGDWRQLAAAVEPFGAVLVDLPGFGASPPPDEAWGAEQYARALDPVLDEFEVPPVIVGFSFGGRLAVHMAASRPDRVKGLVLTGVPLLRKDSSAKPSLGYRMIRGAHRMKLISDQRMEAERRKRGSADYRNASGVMRSVLVRVVNESYEAQLRSIRCPVEMVWADGDTAAPLVMAGLAAQLIENSRLTVIPGRSHFLPVEEPAAITAAIKGLI